MQQKKIENNKTNTTLNRSYIEFYHFEHRKISIAPSVQERTGKLVQKNKSNLQKVKDGHSENVRAVETMKES